MHEAFPTQQTAHWLGLQLCHPQSDAELLRLHPATSVAVSHITAHEVTGIFLSSSLVCRVCDRGADFASAAGCKSWSCVWPSEIGCSSPECHGPCGRRPILYCLVYMLVCSCWSACILHLTCQHRYSASELNATRHGRLRTTSLRGISQISCCHPGLTLGFHSRTVVPQPAQAVDPHNDI